MASKNALTSIGLKVAIAIEATAGTRPTSNYYTIPGVTELPDLDFEPDTIETTSFDNTDYKSYLPGLKDTGGNVSFGANYTDYGFQMWNDIVDDLGADTTGKIAWILISIEGTDQKWFIPVKPVECGVPSTTVNDKVSINYNFTVVKDIETAVLDATAFVGYISATDYPL